MSLTGLPSAPQDQEHALLAAPRRDVAVTTVVVLLTATLFAAVANHTALTHIQRLDDGWLRLMISGRSAPLTATAMVFNVLGLVYITLPVRIAIAVFLAMRPPMVAHGRVHCGRRNVRDNDRHAERNL